MSFLSSIGIDPTFLVGGAIALGTYIYHRLVPPKTNDTLTDALATAKSVMKSLIAQAPAGVDVRSLEAQLIGAAKIQLAHIGLSADKLPPAAQAAMTALVDEMLLFWKSLPDKK